MVAISIVIPVYNLENYLRESLDSIINQTFTDFEVICVNDGSKDKSLEILEEYKKKDNRFIVLSQENSGAGMARNHGLEVAQGKYVQFLDGDDYFEPDMLEKLYNCAEKFGADIAVCASRKVDENGLVIESGNPNSPLNKDLVPFDKTFSYQDFPEDIFNLSGNAPWNKLYSRDMIMKNELRYPDLTGPDDMCFVHMANVCAKKIAAIPDELINYRFNRPGSVQTYRANHTIDIVKACFYIKDFLVKKGIYEAIEKAYLKILTSSVRWEISLCNDEQYENFKQELVRLFPNDWKKINSALKKDYITPEYINNFIKDKKVMLWGASLFIRKVLECEKEKNPNILGIIDRNTASWGTMCGNYEIFSPEILETKKPEAVLLTVFSNNETLYESMKKDFAQKYPDIELLPNIFESEV